MNAASNDTIASWPADLVITHARIFDGNSASLVDGDVVVRNGRILAVVADGDERPAGIDDHTTVVEADGKVVIPGLIDAHFHAYAVGLDLFEIETTPLSYVAVRATQRLGRALRRGFTTVRDVAGGDAGLARAIAEHQFSSPGYLHTGPALSQTGGHGDPHPGDRQASAGCCTMTEVVDGVDDLRRAVRVRLRAGAHAIKIMTSGGVVSPTDPLRMAQYSAEEIRAVTDEAIRRGSYVAAHAYFPEAIIHSVTNGVRSIEHGNLLDADTARVMADHHAVLVPTLVAYDALDRRGPELGLAAVSQAKNREVLAAGQHAIELAAEAGVTIGFGSDLMGDLEDEQLQGLRLQTEVQGVLGALRAATSGNAAVLRRDDIGRLEEGCLADMVLLDRDPFTDPSALWEPRRTVILAGQVV